MFESFLSAVTVLELAVLMQDGALVLTRTWSSVLAVYLAFAVISSHTVLAGCVLVNALLWMIERAKSKQIETLRKELRFQAEELARKEETAQKTARAEVEGMRRQALNQNNQLASLLDENAKLRRQLEDYDFMFGERRKKEV